MILSVTDGERRGQAPPALVIHERTLGLPAFDRREIDVLATARGLAAGERLLDESDAAVAVFVLASSDLPTSGTVLDLVERLRTRRPELGLVAVLDRPNAALLRALLGSGVNACCVSAPNTSLAAAVSAAACGSTWLDAESSRALFSAGAGDRTAPPHLSPREREILSLLTDGHTNEEIADLLACAPATVKTHLVHLFRKLAVRDRVSAAVWAMRNGHL